MLALSDGRTLNVGRVRAKDGLPGRDADPVKDGESVASANVNGDGHLILTMTDGREIDAGLAVREGKPGLSIKGDPGVGISKAEIVGGNLTIHLTNGTKQLLGRVAGKDGETKIVEIPTPVAGATIEIGDLFPARISARDLDRLMIREITIDGETFQVLVPK